MVTYYVRGTRSVYHAYAYDSELRNTKFGFHAIVMTNADALHALQPSDVDDVKVYTD